MSPKKAIIILLIMVIIIAIVFAVLYYFYPQSQQISQPAPSIKELKDGEEELPPAELRQRMLDDLDKISDQEYKEKLKNLTNKEKEESKQRMLDDLDKISE